MRISLVVNTYNRMHTLPNTLDSLQYLRYPDLEVIVVDGPSTDGTLEYLHANWQGKVKIATCPAANLSMSRNIGIDHATGEIVVFIDDDGIPEPDWLNELSRAYTDRGVGAAGGFVRNHTGVEFQTRYIISGRNGESEVLIDDASRLPQAKPGVFKVPGMIGVNSSFRRSVLHEVGGFDEQYAYFLDETDVIFRLVDAGYDVKMIPSAEVHHKYAPSHIRSEKGIARTWLTIARSTAYFCLQNATPDMPLDENLYTIEKHRRKLRTHTRWAEEAGLLPTEEAARMYQEIEDGFDTGIRDAFSHPWRQLVKFNPDREWQPFPRLLPPEKRLHLAFTTTLYPPADCGGVGVIIHQMATELARQGHEITVITFAQPGMPHTVDFEDGVWVHRLAGGAGGDLTPTNMPHMPPGLSNNAVGILAELQRVSARRRFDWVIGTIWDLDTAAVIASKRFPVALYLVTSYRLMQDSKPEWKPGSHYFQNHVQPMIEAEKWALENADLVLASTQAIRNDVEQAYELKIADERVELHPFGIRAGTATPDATLGKPVRVLYLGRFETRKGIDTLMQALPELLENNPELHVTLAGDNRLPGPDGRTYLEIFQQNHASAPWLSRIDIPGLLDEQQLQQAYADCDIFVAPSRYESFGLIYLEAMRYGKPCIGCNSGGVVEIIQHQETGLLVPPADAKALGAAIQQLVASSTLRQQYGEAGFQRFKEKFTLDAFATRLGSSLKERLKLIIR